MGTLLYRVHHLGGRYFAKRFDPDDFTEWGYVNTLVQEGTPVIIVENLEDLNDLPDFMVDVAEIEIV